jgi:hypothetical protein
MLGVLVTRYATRVHLYFKALETRPTSWVISPPPFPLSDFCCRHLCVYASPPPVCPHTHRRSQRHERASERGRGRKQSARHRDARNTEREGGKQRIEPVRSRATTRQGGSSHPNASRRGYQHRACPWRGEWADGEGQVEVRRRGKSSRVLTSEAAGFWAGFWAALSCFCLSLACSIGWTLLYAHATVVQASVRR